jgi:hypothetical protein
MELPQAPSQLGRTPNCRSHTPGWVRCCTIRAPVGLDAPGRCEGTPGRPSMLLKPLLDASSQLLEIGCFWRVAEPGRRFAMPRTFIALAASRLGRPCRFDSPHGPPSPHPAAGAPAAARSVMPATSKARSPNLVALSPQRRSSCRRRGTCASLGASARQGLAPPPSPAPSRPNLGRPLTAGRARTTRGRTRRL